MPRQFPHHLPRHSEGKDTGVRRNFEYFEYSERPLGNSAC